ncbi:MAG: CPBP family intramembrane metalloprotease [Planctomycetales bacterium]|nr:CPBP family intramembrane metalloprotease [Planctomycetales bacterium]
MGEPVLYLGGVAVIGYFYSLWLQDYRRNARDLVAAGVDQMPAAAAIRAANQIGAQSLPGAMPVGLPVVTIAVLGGLLILGVEVAGEYGLGIVAEQTEMTVLFGIYTLAAAFLEELIFRGFFYYERGGRVGLVLSILLVSILFALLHPYLWKFEPRDEIPWSEFYRCWSLDSSTKAVFSTTIVMVNSLWFYAVRFLPLNRYRSLIPCVAAHFASNLGVFLIKLGQGKVVGFF